MSELRRKLKNIPGPQLVQIVRSHERMGEWSGHPVEEITDHQLVNSARAHPDRTVGRWLSELETDPLMVMD